MRGTAPRPRVHNWERILNWSELRSGLRAQLARILEALVAKIYRGTRSRADFINQLTSVAERLGIEPAAVKVRPLAGSRTGMAIEFSVGGQTIRRSCDSQPTKDQNFACLVLWFQALVRNVERRIEQLDEAFRAEGFKALPANAGEAERYGSTHVSYYRGNMSPEQARARIGSALGRLGLTMNDCRVEWSEDPLHARLLLRLANGRIVQKVSDRQETAVQNLAALALWLETRALNYERGIEQDFDRLFAANLLPAGREA